MIARLILMLFLAAITWLMPHVGYVGLDQIDLWNIASSPYYPAYGLQGTLAATYGPVPARMYWAAAYCGADFELTRNIASSLWTAASFWLLTRNASYLRLLAISLLLTVTSVAGFGSCLWDLTWTIPLIALSDHPSVPPLVRWLCRGLSITVHPLSAVAASITAWWRDRHAPMWSAIGGLLIALAIAFPWPMTFVAQLAANHHWSGPGARFATRATIPEDMVSASRILVSGQHVGGRVPVGLGPTLLTMGMVLSNLPWSAIGWFAQTTLRLVTGCPPWTHYWIPMVPVLFRPAPIAAEKGAKPCA